MAEGVLEREYIHSSSYRLRGMAVPQLVRVNVEARAALAGSVEMLTQGMEIDAPEETWLWQGVLMKEVLKEVFSEEAEKLKSTSFLDRLAEMNCEVPLTWIRGYKFK